MEKLNELVEALYPQYGAPGSRDVDVTARRKAIDESAAAIAEAFRALEQRAEAAEAKLAELEKQEPVAYRWERTTGKRYASYKLAGKDVEPLFTRPAPAINLTELADVTRRVIDTGLLATPEHECLEANLYAMLRNIEEAG
ncbi:hypothetical protein [Pantoea sp. Ep11b]|uniref:hypothetical protein n=1 Tax=Pantoea sp. Ep11b TaxID=3141459 RepID=UPI003460B9E4